MTVSISRMNIEYYLSTIAVGDTAASRRHLTNYYTASGDPAGTWFGKGLDGIGRTTEQTVTKADARAVYEDVAHPDTKVALGKRPMQKTEAPTGAKTASGRPARKKTREAVAGFDLTFSAPKSVSALWAVADSATQATIHQAHQSAVRQSLTWLESNVLQSRAGDGGVAKVEIQGMIASLFDHFDSRAGDPQIHTHAVLANRVQRASDGAWVTLDSYALHKWVVAASEMYNALLFDELAQTAGTSTEQRKPLQEVIDTAVENSNGNRRIELIGVPDELIAEFSQRSSSIAYRTNELIADWKAMHGDNISEETIIELRRKATLESRDAKPVDKKPLQSRLYEWRQRTRALQLEPHQIVAAATGHPNSVFTLESLTPEAIEEIAQHVIDRTIIKHPTFNRANLMASTHRLLGNIRCQSLQERNQITDVIIEKALEQAVELTPDRYELDHLTQAGLTLRGVSVFDRPEEKIFTIQSVLDTEKTLMDAAQGTTGAHLSDAEAAYKVLSEHRSDQGHALAPDQLDAAYKVTTSPTGISAIIGPAGTGKTSTLAGVRAAWESQNGEGSVIGLAPSAAAASVLGKELGISTDNTAKWLYESVGDGVARRAERYAKTSERIAALETQMRDSPGNRSIAARLDAEHTKLATLVAEQSKYQIRPGQLLIVDEASMSSTSDLHQLYQQVEAAGGKMLLVGDPKQLDAVDAGGFLGWMENNELSANLTSVWRFKADWEKTASLQLRQGDIKVIDTYREQGRIIDTDDILEAAYAGWSQDTRAGKSSVLIAGTNADVLELNQRAQAERIELEAVDTSEKFAIRAGLTAYKGDTILARQNNRQLIDSEGDFIKNGTRMIVEDVLADRVNARREDTGATVQLPLSYARQSVELGYACTIHRAQGLTVETCHVGVDETYGREQLYVAMTRGKESNKVYVHAEGVAEAPEAADNWGMMKAVVAQDSNELLGQVLNKTTGDKTAHETMDAEYGWALDLGRAARELDYVADLSATRRTHQWFTEQFSQDVQQVADTPELKKLIKAVKESEADFSDLPQAMTVPEATTYFEQRRAEADLSLLAVPRHMTEDEAEAAAAITDKINSRLDTLKGMSSQEPWFIELKATAPAAADAVLTWRALSNQTDADTMLGDPPKASERRLTDFFEQVKDIVEQAEARETRTLAYTDHNLIDTGDSWQQGTGGAQWYEWTPAHSPAPEYQPAPESGPDMR